jgi:hypothetical protein
MDGDGRAQIAYQPWHELAQFFRAARAAADEKKLVARRSAHARKPLRTFSQTLGNLLKNALRNIMAIAFVDAAEVV